MVLFLFNTGVLGVHPMPMLRVGATHAPLLRVLSGVGVSPVRVPLHIRAPADGRRKMADPGIVHGVVGRLRVLHAVLARAVPRSDATPAFHRCCSRAHRRAFCRERNDVEW